jgi:hypothetical protein
MNFAILGTDPDILQLAAAARKNGHELVWIGDIRSEDAAAIGTLAADHTDRSYEWELILDRAIADGVFVGRGRASSDLRAEQLKRLAAEAMPLLVVHPVFESVLPYYEIDMTRRETGAVIRHFNPLVGLPKTAELAEWVRSGHPIVGPIHQLTFERRMAGGSRAAVLAHLARDVELLAAVGGDIRRVSAIGPASLDASFASLQVQMTATNIASLRWSVGSAATNATGLQLTLLGERGTVTLRELTTATAESPGWEIEVASDGQPNVQPLATFDAAQLAIERFANSIAETNSEDRAAASTWEAATRSMEVVDAIELSLQKGRTIEVFQQHLTEQLAFRGTMAALGCGLLLIAFLALFAVALLGGAEGIVKEKIAPAWPLVLLAVLAFFLLLQAIPMLARKPKKG